MTRWSGYGWSASAISSSLTCGPYESAVSIRLIPSSTARRSTRSERSRSGGSPQTPSPTIRIAPKPSRFTVMSAMSNVPAALASAMAVSVPARVGLNRAGLAPDRRRDRRRRAGRSRRSAEADRGGDRLRRARGAGPCGRAHAQPFDRRREDRRGGRAVGRADADAGARADAGTRARVLPDLQQGREPVPVRGDGESPFGDDPEGL